MRRTLSKEFRERLVVHEAGHLLVAYCMGLPVAAYTANDAILNACQFFEVEDDIAGTHPALPRALVDPQVLG